MQLPILSHYSELRTSAAVLITGEDSQLGHKHTSSVHSRGEGPTQASLIRKLLRRLCFSLLHWWHEVPQDFQNSMFHAIQEGASARHLSILFRCLCGCATVDPSARNSRKPWSITRHNKAHAPPSSPSLSRRITSPVSQTDLTAAPRATKRPTSLGVEK